MVGPPRRWAAGAAVLALALGARAGWTQRFVQTRDPLWPRIRYADSLDSPNDRCAVSGKHLNLKVRPVYVNGTPIGFC